MSMFCENCGAKLADDAKFCEECGAKILPASQVPPPSGQEQGTYFNQNQQSGNIGSFYNQGGVQNYNHQQPGSFNNYGPYSGQNQGYMNSEQQPGQYNNQNGSQYQGYMNSEQQPGQYNNQNGSQYQGYMNPEQQPGQYTGQNVGQNRGYAPAPGNPKKSGLPKVAIIGGVALIVVAAVGAFLIFGKLKGGKDEDENVTIETSMSPDQTIYPTTQILESESYETQTTTGTDIKSAREQAEELDASKGNDYFDNTTESDDGYQYSKNQDNSSSDTISTDMIGQKAKDIADNLENNSGSSNSSNEEEFLPSTFAKKGKRDILQDGTVMYMNSVGDYMANVWVQDSDNGKYYYTGPDGCMIKDNYSADGYWCGSDGQWDTSVKQRNEDPEPNTGTYEGFVATWKVEITKDSKYGTATHTYTEFGGTPQVYDLTPVGHGVYIAENEYGTIAYMSVTNNGRTLIVSEAGITEECTLK